MVQLQLTREQASALSMAIMQRCMKIEELIEIFKSDEMEILVRDYKEEMATLQGIKENLFKSISMRNRIQMPVRSKYKPTATKVETREQSIIRKYTEVYGCSIREARQMLNRLELSIKLSKPELYVYQG